MTFTCGLCHIERAMSEFRTVKDAVDTPFGPIDFILCAKCKKKYQPILDLGTETFIEKVLKNNETQA